MRYFLRFLTIAFAITQVCPILALAAGETGAESPLAGSLSSVEHLRSETVASLDTDLSEPHEADFSTLATDPVSSTLTPVQASFYPDSDASFGHLELHFNNPTPIPAPSSSSPADTATVTLSPSLPSARCYVDTATAERVEWNLAQPQWSLDAAWNSATSSALVNLRNASKPADITDIFVACRVPRADTSGPLTSMPSITLITLSSGSAGPLVQYSISSTQPPISTSGNLRMRVGPQTPFDFTASPNEPTLLPDLFYLRPDAGPVPWNGAYQYNTADKSSGSYQLNFHPICSFARASYMGSTFERRVLQMNSAPRIVLSLRPSRLSTFWTRFGFRSVPLTDVATGLTTYRQFCFPETADPSSRGCYVPRHPPEFPDWVKIDNSIACMADPATGPAFTSGCDPSFVNAAVVSSATKQGAISVTLKASQTVLGNIDLAPREFTAVAQMPAAVVADLRGSSATCAGVYGSTTVNCKTFSVADDGVVTATFIDGQQTLQANTATPAVTISFSTARSLPASTPLQLSAITAGGNFLQAPASTTLGTDVNMDSIVDTSTATAYIVGSNTVIFAKVPADYNPGGGDLDAATFAAAVKNVANGNTVACQRAFFFGSASNGSPSSVGYTLTSHDSSYGSYRTNSFISPSTTGLTSHIPLFALVCSSVPASTSVSLTLYSTQQPGAYVVADSVPVATSPLASGLCHRVSVTVSPSSTPSQTSISAASAAAKAAIESALGGVLADGADAGTAFFSYASTGSVLRVCAKGSKDGNSQAVENSILNSFIVANTQDALNNLLLPALTANGFGAGTTVTPSGSLSVQYPNWDLKCEVRPHMGSGVPARSACVRERCTNKMPFPALCYFGSTVVPDAECTALTPVNLAMHGACDISFTDVGAFLTEGFGDELPSVMVQPQLTPASNKQSTRDLPSVRVRVTLPEFDFTSVASYELYQTRGPNTPESPLPSSMLTTDTTSLSIEFTSHFDRFFVFKFQPPNGFDVSRFHFATFSIESVTDPSYIFFSSTSVPTPPATYGIIAATGKAHLQLQVPEFPDWIEITPVMATAVFDSVSVAFECQAAPYPTAASVADDIAAGRPAGIVPNAFLELGSTSMSESTIISTFTTGTSSFTKDVPFFVHCFGLVTAGFPPPTRVGLSFAGTSKGVRFSSRVIPITPPPATPSLALIRFAGPNLAADVAASLKTAFASWSDNSIDAHGVDARDNTETSTVVLRVPPRLFSFLPPADVLNAAFSDLTSGATLLLPDGTSNPKDVTNDALYTPTDEGNWLCGSDGFYAECEYPSTYCSEVYSAPLRCAQPNDAHLPESFNALVACAFDTEPLPTLPVKTGCGAFMCMLPDSDPSAGAITGCSDARICRSGCQHEVEITNQVIVSNPEFTYFCVVNGNLANPSLCPPSLVSEPTYAATCNATSTCGTVCVSSAASGTTGAGKRVDCSGPDSWSACSDPCKGGTMSRNARCADTTTEMGADAAAAVPVSLCPGGSLSEGMERSCAGDKAVCPGPLVTAAADATTPGEYVITWDNADGMAEPDGNAVVAIVVVSADGAATGTETPMGTFATSVGRMTFDQVSKSIAPGKYVATVILDGVLKGTSSEFVISPGCSVVPCVNGMCDSQTGKCTCMGDWSGTICDVSPCTRKQCRPGTSTQCSVSPDGFARCDCLGNWSGDLCQTSPCTFKGCKSDSSTCSVSNQGFAQCDCLGEWKGEKCDVSPCTPTSCNNGMGECTVNSAGNPVCACKGAWVGTDCSVSPCDSETCNNGKGTCAPNDDGLAVCTCIGDWGGDKCTVSPCASRGCSAGTSTCVVSSAGIASCKCEGEWSGDKCTVSPCDTKGCDPSGSTCSVVNNAAVCTCKGDWRGPLCNVGPCEGVDCNGDKGSCFENSANKAQCECVGEWSGEKCSASPCDIKNCNTIGSSCSVNSTNQATCECKGQWSGDLCDLSPCNAQSCNNGKGECSVDSNGLPKCACLGEWTGDECDVSPCATKGCNPNFSECSNGDDNTATCSCIGDWFGDLCDVSPCDSKGCNEQGSTCASNDAGVAVCTCKGEWLGDLCDESPCTKKGCSASTTSSCLINEAGAAICTCFGDWSGEVCDVSPCDNSSICPGAKNMCHVNSTTGAAQCQCRGEWSGEECTVSPCDSKGCVNGECNVDPSDDRAVCTCKGAWSGELCDASPCDSKDCNAAAGNSCSVSDAGQAVCSCLGDWSGDDCAISPCDSKGCREGSSTCSVDNTGKAQCACTGDWKGDKCDESPCLTKGCRAESSTCVETEAGEAECKCLGEWSGVLCDADPCVTGCNPAVSTCTFNETGHSKCTCFTGPDGAPLHYGAKCDIPADYCEVNFPCHRGGTRSLEFLEDGSFSCTDCACVGSWSSSTDCETCGLPCAHKTSPMDDCASCKCSDIMGGYSGSFCECRSAFMTFVVLDKDIPTLSAAVASSASGDDVAKILNDFATLFSLDLTRATSIPHIASVGTPVAGVSASDGTKYHTLTLAVGPSCDRGNAASDITDALMGPTYAAINAAKTFFTEKRHETSDNLALSLLHQPSGFGAMDPNCKLGEGLCPSGWEGNGLYTKEKLDCYGVDVDHPDCKGNNVKSKGGLSLGAIIGIAVGGGIGLILIILLICWAAGCFAKKAAVDHGGSAVQMASV